MTARAQAQCAPSCALYRSPFSPEGQASGATEPFCQPFPQGIPDDIWENRFDHRQVHPDQVGEQVWTAAGPGVEFPTYALNVTESETITAAADVLDGAMIALVPSPADLERLAIPGGEPLDQLHLTLVYLGEAALIEQPTRDELIAWARDIAPTWDSVDGDGFAPSWFNPLGEEPCLTLVCSGADLAEMHETALADAADVMDLPEQHQPFIPHVTIAYIDNDPESGGAMAMFDQFGMDGHVRTGPIVFDRIRLAFGGEVIDVPLGSPIEAAPAPQSVPDSSTAQPDAAVSVAAASPSLVREVWDGPLH